MYNRNALAAYICWKCKKGTGHHFQLYNVKIEQTNKKGEVELIKTQDYVCNTCKQQGFYLPEADNSSRILLPKLTKKEYQKLVQEEREALAKKHQELARAAQAASPEPDVINIKKEGNTTIQKVSTSGAAAY